MNQRQWTAQRLLDNLNSSRWSCRAVKQLRLFTARLDLWTRIWEILSGYAIRNCQNRESIDLSARARCDAFARFLCYGCAMALLRAAARLAFDPMSPPSSTLFLSAVIFNTPLASESLPNPSPKHPSSNGILQTELTLDTIVS